MAEGIPRAVGRLDRAVNARLPAMSEQGAEGDLLGFRQAARSGAHGFTSAEDRLAHQAPCHVLADKRGHGLVVSFGEGDHEIAEYLFTGSIAAVRGGADHHHVPSL